MLGRAIPAGTVLKSATTAIKTPLELNLDLGSDTIQSGSTEDYGYHWDTALEAIWLSLPILLLGLSPRAQTHRTGRRKLSTVGSLPWRASLGNSEAAKLNTHQSSGASVLEGPYSIHDFVITRYSTSYHCFTCLLIH